MYTTIFTLHIIGATLFFSASLVTFFSYFKSYSMETYRKLSLGISALLFGEFTSGSLLAIITYKPLNYLHLCTFITLYTLIALATFYTLRQRLKENKEPLPSFVYTFSFAGIISLFFVFI